MTPTNELRFIRRIEQGNESQYERTVLQQKWQLEIPRAGQTYIVPDSEEWRDVPLVTEGGEDDTGN